MQKSRSGFTIVELLIVIVIIGILASITIVAFSGVQARARDSQRQTDITAIRKAMELYFADNGTYPSTHCSLGAGCKINSGWNTTSDGSWSNLSSQLAPKYIDKLPSDPLASTANPSAIGGGYNYDMVANPGWCQPPVRPSYMITYRLESSAQERKLEGDCSAGTSPTNYSSSEYYIIK
ncbi:MAG: prepilin-type N-terminal cleavage/methylation domain-containing protein [Candidatus Saccharimonadales bacterium]